MAIYIVRHGETTLNAARVFQHPDTPLSERGIAQAECVARRVADLGVDAILASDYRRAQMTAETLAKKTNLEIVYDASLRERNFGDLRGQAHADLDFDAHDENYKPENGESWPEFYARVSEAWSSVRDHAAATNGNLAVITHGLVCMALAERHFGLVRGEDMPDHWPNTALTIVDSEYPHTVQLAGCGAHLDSPDVADGGRMYGL